MRLMVRCVYGACTLPACPCWPVSQHMFHRVPAGSSLQQRLIHFMTRPFDLLAEPLVRTEVKDVVCLWNEASVAEIDL